MSAYQNKDLSVESDKNPQEVVAVSPGRNAPKPCLRRSWYSLTFSDDEEEHSPSGLDGILASACATTLEASDACSEASTDVGVDFVDDAEQEDDCEAEVELSSAIEHEQVQTRSAPSRPSFPKLSRQQRVDQLRRILDEFCAMDFDSVDASCQGGLVLRMLTTLKSFKESTNFFEGEKRLAGTRFSLLEFGQADEDVIDEASAQAEELCEGRVFRAAFDILKELRPRLRGEVIPASQHLSTEEAEVPPTSKHLSTEEAEAMAQRRLEKRLRQREERRGQRGAERVERSARRGKDKSAQSTCC